MKQEYLEKYVAQYERIDGIAKLIVFTEIEISWVILKLEGQDRRVTY